MLIGDQAPASIATKNFRGNNHFSPTKSCFQYFIHKIAEPANFVLQYCILDFDEEQVWLLWDPMNAKNSWTTGVPWFGLYKFLISEKCCSSVSFWLYIWHSEDVTIIKLVPHRNWECNGVQQFFCWFCLILPCFVRNNEIKTLSDKVVVSSECFWFKYLLQRVLLQFNFSSDVLESIAAAAALVWWHCDWHGLV